MEMDGERSQQLSNMPVFHRQGINMVLSWKRSAVFFSPPADLASTILLKASYYTIHHIPSGAFLPSTLLLGDKTTSIPTKTE
jgi:hypothetical protein